MLHIPVLLEEVLHSLDPRENEDAIDATINGGGHAEALLERTGPKGRLLGIDRDQAMLERSRERLKRFGDRVTLVHGNFSNIRTIAERHEVLHPSLILFDLGMSSYHLASGRGFSFQRDEPLDMRFDSQETELTAEAIVNHAPIEELERIFETYGEERKGRRLAEAIASERKHRNLKTAGDLVGLIERIIPRGRIHPATRIFQALRIAVNDELGHVERGIRAAIEVLAPGGRLAIISFHSLEDRIVKNIFRESKDLGEISKKPIAAGPGEIRENPRARSAKLRVFRKYETV